MRWIDKMATVSRLCPSRETDRETSQWYCTGTLITNLNNNNNNKTTINSNKNSPFQIVIITITQTKPTTGAYNKRE